jgi:hypothetical protein
MCFPSVVHARRQKRVKTVYAPFPNIALTVVWKEVRLDERGNQKFPFWVLPRVCLGGRLGRPTLKGAYAKCAMLRI